MARLDYAALNSTVRYTMWSVFRVEPGRLGDDRVAAATQAAIWHYTDGFELAGQGNDPVVVANYEAILAAVAAGVLPTFGEPGVSLDIEAPGTTEATAGEPIGPYVVRTTAGEVTLTGSPGAEIVDEHGEPLPGPVTDGTSFWLVSQEPGPATVTATAEATVLAGRAFAKPGVQRMILATTTTTTVDAEASGSQSGAAARRPKVPGAAAQPWKRSTANTRGFQRMSAPRKVGGGG